MATILCVEDEPALQQALSEFLRSKGHEVISASDGEAGLRLLGERKPDLILLDLVLPRVSGLDFLEHMERDQNLKGTPVIVLTNIESNESVERALALGAKAYLIKTNYSLDDVGRKVAAILQDRAF